jgi:hypothetical protein
MVVVLLRMCWSSSSPQRSGHKHCICLHCQHAPTWMQCKVVDAVCK